MAIEVERDEARTRNRARLSQDWLENDHRETISSSRIQTHEYTGSCLDEGSSSDGASSKSPGAIQRLVNNAKISVP